MRVFWLFWRVVVGMSAGFWLPFLLTLGLHEPGLTRGAEIGGLALGTVLSHPAFPYRRIWVRFLCEVAGRDPDEILHPGKVDWAQLNEWEAELKIPLSEGPDGNDGDVPPPVPWNPVRGVIDEDAFRRAWLAASGDRAPVILVPGTFTVLMPPGAEAGGDKALEGQESLIALGINLRAQYLAASQEKAALAGRVSSRGRGGFTSAEQDRWTILQVRLTRIEERLKWLADTDE